MAHSVARACSMGRLLSCGCDPSNYKGKTPAKARGVQWKWGGCSHNLDYGMEFSRQFLDTRERAGDIQSTVNLHNNQAGRLVSITFTCLLLSHQQDRIIHSPRERKNIGEEGRKKKKSESTLYYILDERFFLYTSYHDNYMIELDYS